jgi:uncharacterized protein GlcG (DUF336 family)
MKKFSFALSVISINAFSSQTILAASRDSCAPLPDHSKLKAALVEVAQEENLGIFKPSLLWATITDASGTICAVANISDAWLASRVISAQKSFTAVSLSNSKLAISSAQLYSLTQPGASLFGLQHSNPIDAEAAYAGNASQFGTSKDPLVGKRIGGINVFGGGLALYSKDKKVVGGLGVSGDTSCTDHLTAWKLRAKLELQSIPSGLSSEKNDNMIFDIDTSGKSASGFGHPSCSDAVKGAIIKLK